MRSLAKDPAADSLQVMRVGKGKLGYSLGHQNRPKHGVNARYI